MLQVLGRDSDGVTLLEEVTPTLFILWFIYGLVCSAANKAVHGGSTHNKQRGRKGERKGKYNVFSDGPNRERCLN